MTVKKILCCILCLSICIYSTTTVVLADSYCVLSDADNTIIEAKNKDEKQSVASISKIMTAVVALEHGKLSDTWKVSSDIQKAYGSSIYLVEGQQVTLESLLYGLMLRSGNDAAVEIAKHIAKDEESFVKLMNEKAKMLGMTNTVFANSSGLDEKDDGNISTANDMALLMSYAMKNSDFRKITGAQYYTSEWNYHWKNKNKLIFDYPFAIGGKTGFTKKAGRTLVSAATHNGVESIVVTLRTQDDFAFHEQKHTEVFNTMDVISILKKGDYVVNQRKFHVPQDIRVTLKKDGSDKLQVKTHFDHKDFVVEVMKNKEVTVYTFSTKKVKENPIKRWFT